MVFQYAIENIMWVDDLDSFDDVSLSEAVQSRQGETTGKHFAPLLEDGLNLVVKGLVTGKSFIGHLGEPACCGGHKDTRTVEQLGGFVSFPDEPSRLKHVDEAH